MKTLIFTTNSNPEMARNIAEKTSLQIGNALFSKFPDSEISLVIKNNVKNKNVIAMGSTFPPAENLIELLILIDTLKLNGAKKVKAVIPYFGYARSDHQYAAGTPIAAKLMARLLETSGASSIVAIDLHNPRVEKFFKIPVTHISAIPLLATEVRKMKIENLTIASPDKGGVDRAKKFAKELGVKQIITITKKHPTPSEVEVIDAIGDIKGKNVVIVDDMVQSGQTILRAAAILKKKGARDIYVAATHLVQTGPGIEAMEKEKNIKHIFAANTALTNPKKLSGKFTILSVDNLIAKVL